MKSGLKYIDKFIHFEIEKILKEDIVNNPVKDAQEQIKQNEEELDSINKDIKDFKNWETDTASDIKGFQQKQRMSKDPIEKTIATTSLNKVAVPKDKALKQKISDKEKELSNLENRMKSDKMKLSLAQKGMTTSVDSSNTEGIAENKTQNTKISLPMISRTFAEGNEENTPSLNTPLESSNKAYLVKFDQNTEAPFEAKFTERGFSINGTRLSFEALENALSKNYTITLNNGKGLMLDAIRMQKILKYKDKWFNGQQ